MNSNTKVTNLSLILLTSKDDIYRESQSINSSFFTWPAGYSHDQALAYSFTAATTDDVIKNAAISVQYIMHAQPTEALIFV